MLTHIITLESEIEPEPLRRIGEHEVEDRIAVIHIVNVDEFEGVDYKQAPETKFSLHSKLAITLILSLALHVITFYVISLRIQIPYFSDKNEGSIIIQAKLFSQPPVSRPEVNEPIASEPISLPEVERTTNQEEAAKTVTIEEVQNETVETSSTSPIVINEHVIEQATEAQSNEKPTSIFSSRAATDVLKTERKNLNNMTNEAVEEFQYRKAHPEIKAIPRKELTPQQQIQKSYSVNLDCSNDTQKSVGKAFGIISGLGYFSKFGKGPIQCRKSGDIKSFIQNSVDKKAHKLYR